MNELLTQVLISALFGTCGAIARVLIDTVKFFQIKTKILVSGLSLYGLVVIVTGTLAGILLDYGKIGSALAGYVGLDLVDGIYGQFKKSKIEAKR
jgi:hypothetical protein